MRARLVLAAAVLVATAIPASAQKFHLEEATIAFGVFGGAAIAFQVSERKSFTPASAMVGTSGTDGTRGSTVTASILILPAW